MTVTSHSSAPAGARLFRRSVFGEAAQGFQLTRDLLLRGLGCIYLVGFVILVRQGLPLLGEAGLLPIQNYLARVARALPSWPERLWAVPSLLWLDCSDATLLWLSWLGVALSLCVVAGLGNALVLALLWLLYGAFVHVGQIFYGYGWEMLLLEAGFLGIFLAPPGWPRARRVPPLPVLWLYRWLLFRLMLGAGLIKLRGDDCWVELTCLVHHYETQPIPHPISWLLHQAPGWFHAGGVLFNHLVELVVPFGLFGPRRLRLVAGSLTAVFQVMLILSGNLAFLNWLTLVLAICCFDDAALGRVLPRRFAERRIRSDLAPLSRSGRFVISGLCVLVGVLSIQPALNLLSPRQQMNAGFDPLGLVNTYGAFGSVSRVRHEIVIEGAVAPEPGRAASARVRPGELSFREYELPCKPGDPMRAPCWATPYHYRLDWQMWFAAMGPPERQPWLFPLVYKLLRGDRDVRSLFETDPFPDRPPDYLRATLYRYEFTHFGEEGWWHRTRVGPYLPLLTVDDPRLARVLERMGWR